MNYLQEIEINFPNTDTKFFAELTEFLDLPKTLKSHDDFKPKLKIQELEKSTLTTGFNLTNECLSVEIKNNTGQERASSYKYSHIEFPELKERIKSDNFLYIDHLGINLPWFEKDAHPLIVELRNKLKDKSLYHLFPTGDNWDFVIPGSLEEISGAIPVDYELDRKPKFEIVSFDGCSTPLVQIDIATNLEYEYIKDLFPEGIHLDDIKSVWVYLKSNYSFDVCLVLNEAGRGWTKFFKDHRLD